MDGNQGFYFKREFFYLGSNTCSLDALVSFEEAVKIDFDMQSIIIIFF
jgi:hypothetical protein